MKRKAIPDSQPATESMAVELGLSPDEYRYVCAKLGRTPNYAEAGIFSVMYSEHCSYKSSRHSLKRLPTRGKRVLQGPGENAGIIDIGEGWAIAFKMESHNHPSFIEPYQGAATGVGGILRDVFTMGARPIASMDALCFGEPNDVRTRSIIRGVVRGIGDYGNSVGVPTVAGQTFFHPCYEKNPLVNAFTLGIVRHDGIFRGYASGIGNPVVYVGSKTGRDGVHGATMASKEFSTDEEPDRPTVQVGDPFTEKLLIEATLEAMRSGLVIGIQDMGAAGLTSSSFEMASRAGTGIVVNLDLIPTRESEMSAYELLLSESQERMLLVTEERHLKDLAAVYDKWDLHSVVIGRVVEGNRVQMTLHGETVVDIPVDLVVHPPKAERPKSVPFHLDRQWHLDMARVQAASIEEKLECLISSPSFSYPGPLAEQYDSMVGNRTLETVYADAAILRLRDVKTKSLRLGLSVDCNPRVCWLWPREGGRRAVAEAAVNLAVSGAEPLGLTDCLNFGSPENPEVMWQFDESIEGISEACEELRTPVVSGNVSFYNDTDGTPIYPTPMIGMAGLIAHEHPVPTSFFHEAGLMVAIAGGLEGSLGGSLLAYQLFKSDCGKPKETDLARVRQMIDFLLALPPTQISYAAHDISDGGLLMTLLEMSLYGSETIGCELIAPPTCQMDRFLFGEGLPRVVLAFRPQDEAAVRELGRSHSVELSVVGRTTATEFFSVQLDGRTVLQKSIPEVRARWKCGWKSLFE